MLELRACQTIHIQLLILSAHAMILEVENGRFTRETTSCISKLIAFLEITQYERQWEGSTSRASTWTEAYFHANLSTQALEW